LAAAVVGLGALSFSSSAQACSCARMSPEAALRQADAAIVGRLIEVVPVDDYSAEYHYLVRRSYKRGTGIRAGGMVAVRSGRNGASCGLPSDESRWYGLFLNSNEGRWTGGLCGLVAPRRLAAAAAEVRRGDELTAGGGLGCTS
jgi:hypothetical protein